MLFDSAIDPHTHAFLCSHIFAGTHPVLYVCKDAGDWQMLCGGLHAAAETPHVVGIGPLLERDPSLQLIMDLRDEWEAERASRDAPWVTKPCDA